MHTTTLPASADMAARSSAVTFSYWIGQLVLLAGSVLNCCIGAISGLQAADDVCSRISSSLTLDLSVVALDSYHIILHFCKMSL